MNLFALTKEASRRIVRVPLDSRVQTEISKIFEDQEKHFNAFVQEEIVFDGKYKPDDGECLKIEDYDDIDNVENAIKAPLSIPEIKPDHFEFESIKALFSGYEEGDETVILLQSFDKRKILSTKGFSIFHSSDVYKKVEGIGLTLDTRLCGILRGKTLKFFNFHNLRQIFDLTQYYKEATDDELKTFSDKENLKIEDFNNFTEMADNWVRRKVSLVMQSGILDNLDIEETKNTALIFKIKIQMEIIDGKNVIVLPPSKAELKKVLRFLDEDYYQSALQKQLFLSNSKRPALG